ncbi:MULTISPECIES: type III secretion protein [Pseudomonas]|uniref:type III secretion protein n=1 Tax=Pseudomonas TaxID=286 RepID=UPI00236207EB|nr:MULTISPECIES: type III secretion protein [unclassified Pseudomonas]
MPSLDATQHRLDAYFQRAQANIDTAALNAANSYSLEDMRTFVQSMNGMSMAMTAVTQQTSIQHNLAKAIIDAMP